MAISPADTLTSLYSMRFEVTVEGNDLTIVGPLHLLDERRRAIIRKNKPGIIALLTCTSEIDDYARDEREAIQFADTPEAQSFLDYALSTFRPAKVTIIDTPERIAEHEQGLISGDDLDDWLSNCNHDPNSGTWHLLDNQRCCRYCGGFYDIIIARHDSSKAVGCKEA